MSDYRFGSARFEVPGGVSFGTNIENVNDWSESPFIDYAKIWRPFAAGGGAAGDSTHEWLKANGHLDANGYPVSLPADTPEFWTIMITVLGEGVSRNFGDFVITWEGEGTITVFGPDLVITSQTSNRIEISIPDRVAAGESNYFLKVQAPNASNYPRNFKMIRPDEQALYDAGEIFRPGYVATGDGARCLRFMSWNLNSYNDLVAWSDRRPLSYATWASGIPFELSVAFCNKVGADGWFCIPHQANDDAITQFATMVRDTLSPGLRAYFEYSNETWNWTLGPAATYCNDQALADWGTNGGDIWRQWHGKRSTQMSQIIRSTWASRWQDCSIVMGTQTVDTTMATAALTAPLWESNEPGSYADPALWHDCLAVTGYYGKLLNAGNTTGIATYKGWYDADPATAHANLIQHLQDEIDNTLIPDLTANKAVADTYGLSMVAYEANSHALFDSLDPNTEGVYLAAAIDTLTSQEAADKHEVMLDAWKAAGGGLLCWFVNIKTHGRAGVWGMVEYLGETTPVDTTVRAWFAANPRWWSEPGRFNAYAPGDRMTGDITFRAGERISSVDTWRAGPATVTVEGQAAASATWLAQAATIWTGV